MIMSSYLTLLAIGQRTKYWQKLNRIGQTIIACGEDSSGWTLPDIVGLCEVENDSVLFDLTRRSLLRKARYEYVMTASNDTRGIDVALFVFSFFLPIDKSRYDTCHTYEGNAPNSRYSTCRR